MVMPEGGHGKRLKEQAAKEKKGSKWGAWRQSVAKIHCVKLSRDASRRLIIVGA